MRHTVSCWGNNQNGILGDGTKIADIGSDGLVLDAQGNILLTGEFALAAAPRGYESAGVVTASLTLPAATYRDAPSIAAAVDRIVQAYATADVVAIRQAQIDLKQAGVCGAGDQDAGAGLGRLIKQGPEQTVIDRCTADHARGAAVGLVVAFGTFGTWQVLRSPWKIDPSRHSGRMSIWPLFADLFRNINYRHFLVPPGSLFLMRWISLIVRWLRFYRFST